MTRAAECRNARDATVRAGSDVAPASMGEGHSARVSAVLPVLVRIGTLGAAADPFETPAFPTRQEAEIFHRRAGHRGGRRLGWDHLSRKSSPLYPFWPPMNSSTPALNSAGWLSNMLWVAPGMSSRLTSGSSASSLSVTASR
jgi:hypothetical protein